MTSILRKRELPIILLAIAQIVLLINGYFTNAMIKSVATEFSTFAIVIAAFAFILNSTQLTTQHAYNIQKRLRGKWVYSIVLIISLFVTIIVGLVYGKNGTPLLWINRNIQVPGAWGMGGMILFYLITAAWRAFRVQNVDSALLFIGCVLVSLGSAPFIAYLSPTMVSLKDWLNDYNVVPVTRAFEMTAAIGGIIFGWRVLFGMERKYMD